MTDPDTLPLYARRGWSTAYALLCLAAALGMAWFALILTDPLWTAGTARRAAVLEAVPPLLRAGFFALIALVLLWATWSFARTATRAGPIIVLAPDGVTDLRRRRPRLLPWSEVAGASVRSNQLVLEPARREVASGVALRLGGFGSVTIPLSLVTAPRDEVIRHVLAHAPHLAA